MLGRVGRACTGSRIQIGASWQLGASQRVEEQIRPSSSGVARPADVEGRARRTTRPAEHWMAPLINYTNDHVIDRLRSDGAGGRTTPLPKIYGEDSRVKKPEEFFRFTSRYQYIRLLGHGAYGMVW